VGKRRAWTLTAASLAAVIAWLEHGRAFPPGSAGAGSTGGPAALASRIPQRLPERGGPGGSGDLFEFRSWTPPAPPPAAVQPSPPARAEPPPNPYRFAGTATQDGVVKVFLSSGERVYEAKAGEMLDDAWRIQSVGHDWVVLLHVPTNVEQRVEQ
jgi:hypothetical protein